MHKETACTVSVQAVLRVLLRLMRGVNRADTGAGAALDAARSVDLILAVTGGNAAHGALGLAGAAADALIRNLICHFKTPPLQSKPIVLTGGQKIK